MDTKWTGLHQIEGFLTVPSPLSTHADHLLWARNNFVVSTHRHWNCFSHATNAYLFSLLKAFMKYFLNTCPHFLAFLSHIAYIDIYLFCCHKGATVGLCYVLFLTTHQHLCQQSLLSFITYLL